MFAATGDTPFFLLNRPLALLFVLLSILVIVLVSRRTRRTQEAAS